jgi:hypothetical protein
LLSKNVPHTKTKNIGASPYQVSATQPLALLCLAWRQERMEQTELVAYLQATEVASGCFGQCTKQGLQIRRHLKTETMVCNSPMHG